MKKFLMALCAIVLGAVMVFAVACTDKPQPEKIKDGTAITLTENESKNIDLTEYISLPDGYSYTVSSSAPTIATATLNGNTATVKAVKEGSATITASAGDVSVEFAVTVNKANLPAVVDKTALKAEIDKEIAEQGEYTTESFQAYREKLEAAKTVYANANATQTQVDTACQQLKDAFNALTLRKPLEKAGANKNLSVVGGNTIDITLADYIDENNLTGVTYAVTADKTEVVTVGEITEGKVTLTTQEVAEDTDVVITVKASKNGDTTVVINLKVLSEVKPVVKQDSVEQSIDIYALENKTSYLIDFTQNVESNGLDNLVYAVTSAGNGVTLDGNNCLNYQLNGTYTETATVVEFNVTVSYGDGESIYYTYTLKITDTTSYRVVNGTFDNGLDGWTMTGNIGEITERGTFWNEGFPMFNVGKYFSGEQMESAKGTLTSSTFVVGGINKISFMLGAAGNADCYITLEKADGTILAIWRNTKFDDVGNWDMEEIGKTQFACNLVTYVADLTAYAGQTLKIVLHDNAENSFGFFNFDQLVTYYTAEDQLPAGVAVVNELANKAQLQAAVEGALADQGDYTADSFAAYRGKIEAAQAILDKVSATQEEVDNALSAINTAFEALTVRVPEEVEDADKSFGLLAGKNKELNVADYVDDKNLSSLTYQVASNNTLVTVSEIVDGKFTITAGDQSVVGATVTITVKYKEEVVLTVELTVNVTNETAPTLKKTSVEKDVDLYTADNKDDITIDFATNVENLGELDLTYTVTMNGNSEALLLQGTSYTYIYGTYTEQPTVVTFAVKVTFTHNGNPGELNYTYTLNITDTRSYRITNGGFDSDLEDWTLTNADLGGVNADETYWNENIPFNNDGKFFNAYYFNGGAREWAMGTLTSSPFVIGGSGWITYKLGGAKNADKVYLDVIDKNTGDILARFYNNAFSDDGKSTEVRGCTLVAYKADLSDYIGTTVYIRISDNGLNDYGLFFVDSFVTYYTESPDGEFTDAVAVTNKPSTVYDIFNGGFESDMTGWTVSGGDIGAVTSDNGYWNNGNPADEGNKYGKEGDKLFSWWSWNSAANDGQGAEVNREGNMGTLTSNMFVLKAGKYVSFKFGGGENRNVFIQLVNAETGTIIAVFHNDNANGGRLISYNYKVDELAADTLCYFRVVDNAVSGWGCFAADDFRVNLDAAPAESNTAQNHVADYRSVFNGSFETGNLDGWTAPDNNHLGKVTNVENATDWYQTNEGAKDGNYLFTFYTEDMGNKEGNTGVMRSSAFILQKNGIVSFRFGAAHNREVYINVYTTDGRLLATFRNYAYEQATVMVHYYYQFDNTEEISCYFEIVDNATENYGCFIIDDFRANLESAPEGAVLGSDRTK